MNVETAMNDTERRAFLADCELADCTHSLIEHLWTMKTASARLVEAPADNAQAAVVGGGLFAFPSGMSRQSREDVMDSFLFATLVANKAFNPQTENQQWYEKFNEVLAAAGWLSANWSYSRYRSSQQRFTMDQVGLEIIQSVIAAAALPGPATAAMLKVASDAVKALQAQEEPLRLFERQSKMHSGANFRIGACDESDGFVSVGMGAVSFLAQSSVTDVLFWEWASAEVTVYRGEDNLRLSSDGYAKNRQLIKQRLGINAQSAIEEFEL